MLYGRKPATLKKLAAGELNALTADAPPGRDDDTPVPMGQIGPPRWATLEELQAFADEGDRKDE